jgi:hypothetical protein
MKKLIALMLVFFFLFGCASTVIKTKPSGADVYYGEKLLGKTPYTFTSGGIAGSKYMMTLKKDGYNDNVAQIKKDKADWGAIILGCFIGFPFFWATTFPAEYIFEMDKLESNTAGISTSTPVAPSSDAVKIVTVVWTVVNIREGSGDDYPVVATAKQGDKLTVIGESGLWFNVRLEGGQQGWINSRVVKQ